MKKSGKKTNRPISRIIGWSLSLAMLLSSTEGAGVNASALSAEFAEEYVVEFAGNCPEISDYAETGDYAVTGICAEES